MDTENVKKFELLDTEFLTDIVGGASGKCIAGVAVGGFVGGVIAGPWGAAAVGAVGAGFFC